MKKAVYTVITDGKDALQSPVVNPEWDYICFTDAPDRVKPPWKAVELPCS